MQSRYLLVILLLIPIACTIESGSDPVVDFDLLVEQGARALSDGDGLTAHDLFSRALAERPHEPTASMGLVLADLLQFLHFADEIVEFVIDYAGSMTMAQCDDPAGLDPDGNFNDTAHHFIKHIFEPVIDEMLLAMDDAAADEELVLNLSAFPLEFMGQRLADLGGEWDATDVTWLSGTLRLIEAVVDLLQATNLDLDFQLILDSDLVRNLTLGNEIDLLETMSELVEILLHILDDPERPDFLLPLPEQQWRYARSQRDFALGVHHWLVVWDQIGAEQDNQVDDILNYIDRNASGEYDAGEPYAWCSESQFPEWLTGAMPALLAIGWQLQSALAEGTDLDRYPDSYELFDLSALNMLLAEWNIPGAIPTTKVDLAALFTEPPNDEVKQWLTDGLTCLHDEDGIVDTIFCLLDLFE